MKLTRTASRRSLAAALLATAIAASVLLAVPVPALASGDSAATTLVNAESDRCLDVISNNPNPGALVATWDCNGGGNQKFVFAGAGDLRAMGSTVCVDTAVHPAAAGSEIRTAVCDTSSRDQKFALATDGAIVNVVTGLCLSKPAGVVANGTRPVLAACDGSAGQRWIGGVSRGLQLVGPDAAAGIHGVNWADPADNFKTSAIYPSGLDPSDDYATTYARAVPIIQGFKALGANTIRFGINVPTVSGPWWNSYRAVFDAAAANGMNFMLGFWNKTASYTLSDTEKAQFFQMWNTVMADYGSSPYFYADIMNEPVKYSGSAWLDFAAEWLDTFSYFPPSHVVVAGTGADANPSAPCADPRFDGTLLSYHQYTVFGEAYSSASTWKTTMAGRVGPCGDRTVVTEFGDWSYSGIDFNGPRDGDQHVAYMVAMTETIRELGMGSTYWPGYREGDAFSLTSLQGSGPSASLSLVNQSLLDRIHYAWGQSDDAGGDGTVTRTSGFTLGAAATCLVITGQVAVAGAPMKAKDCSVGLARGATDVTQKANGQLGMKWLCIAPATIPAVSGTAVVLRDCASDDSQDWSYDATTKTMTHSASGLCLQGAGGATASDTPIVLGPCTGGDAQRWSRR